jgi:hypothetical protein
MVVAVAAKTRESHDYQQGQGTLAHCQQPEKMRRDDTVLEGYTFMGKVPIERLDQYLSGLNENAPADFQTGYTTDSLKSNNSVILLMVVGTRPNPRHTGTMCWKLINPDNHNKKVVLWETLFCNGKSQCDRPINPTNKKMRCACIVWWEVTADDLHTAHIWARGLHGPHYQFNPWAVHMAPSVRRKLLRSDGLDVRCGGNTTAGHQVILAQECAAAMGVYSQDWAVTQDQVKNLYSYE